jgi:hypothetical protein
VVVSAADTSIVENAATTNYGSSTTIQVDGDDPGGTGKDKSGLISASVTLNVTNISTITYQAYELKRP